MARHDWIPAIEHEIAVTEAKLHTLREELQELINNRTEELSQECAILGGHIDDGGMFYGVCKRCGTHLG